MAPMPKSYSRHGICVTYNNLGNKVVLGFFVQAIDLAPFLHPTYVYIRSRLFLFGYEVLSSKPAQFDQHRNAAHPLQGITCTATNIRKSSCWPALQKTCQENVVTFTSTSEQKRRRTTIRLTTALYDSIIDHLVYPFLDAA